MKKLVKSKYLVPHRIIVWTVVTLLWLINIGYFVNQYKSDTRLKATISEVVSEENDGGILYQNLIIKNADNENLFVRHEILNSDITKFQQGDSVIYEKISEDNYKILSLERGLWMVAIMIFVIVLLTLVVGLDDVKEIIPVLVSLPFIFSGLFLKLLDVTHPLIVFGGFVLLISMFSSYALSNKRSMVFITTLSNMITLMLVLIIHLALVDLFKLADIYTNNLAVKRAMDFDTYWSLLIFSALLIAFGGVINNSIVWAKKAEQLLSVDIQTSKLVQRIIIASQQRIARRLNSLFLVFLGLAVIPMASNIDSNVGFWNDPNLVLYFVLFVISALAVIISLVISAIIAGVYLNLTKEKSHGRIKI